MIIKMEDIEYTYDSDILSEHSHSDIYEENSKL